MSAACRMLLDDSPIPQTMSLDLYVQIFLLTCLLELPIYWRFTRRQLGAFNVFRMLLTLNLATHPAVTWLFPWIFSKTDLMVRDYLLVSELFAIVVETIIITSIYKVRLPKAFVVSLFANLFSWWVGLYVAPALGL